MLNKDQQKAVRYNSGPLLVVAGAGTGKTTVITEKIKYIIEKNKIRPDEVLGLTFTEKSAYEMEQRVDQAIPYGYFQMWISTFHSFADKILRVESSHIGINQGYKLMTEAETIIFLRKNLSLFNFKYFSPLGNPHKFLGSLLQHFSRLKDEDIEPEEYLNWAETQNKQSKAQESDKKQESEKNTELAKAYVKYQKIKVKEGYFDFSDLIYYLLKLFRKRQNILKRYQTQFRYVLVDEFQDTNIAQYSLIKILCLPNNNPKLTIVGDDSQAIYKFRGASVSNIINFQKDYPKAKLITLSKNYRSNQSILDHSYKLIQNNNPDTLESQLGISKKLYSQKNSSNESVKFYLADNVTEETEYVSKQILTLKKKDNCLFSDFALLVRANNHADPFISAFSYYGIPYRFLGPGMLFKQPEIKDLIAYLKLLYNLEDSVSLYRILSMNIFNLDLQDIHLFFAFARKINLSVFQATEIYLSFFNKSWYRSEFNNYKKCLPLIKEETRQKLTDILKMIKRHLSLVKKESAGRIIYLLLEDSKYLQKLISYKTKQEEKITLNITKFLNRLKSFEENHEDSSVFAVVDFIEMSFELGESPTTSEFDISEYEAVNILTIHSSKGLEFPTVFIPSLVNGRFPTYDKKETIPIPDDLIKEILPYGNYHLLEERRLFYVALTRAMNRIYLTSSFYYGESKRQRQISPFITETLDNNVINNFKEKKSEEKNQLSFFDFKRIEEPVIKRKINLNNFSYSQIETYKTCPLQYKYKYILKIPTLPNSSASFGNTIHKTLQQFYEEFKINNLLSLTRLLEIYKQSWIPIGYSSHLHEIRMKKEGEIMLDKFYKIFHPPTSIIIDLEKLFKVKIEKDIYITGKIDRVEKNKDGTIEIIDYKTGKKSDIKNLKKNLQLSIYALAAGSKGLYNKKFEKIKLTYYYLQDLSKVSLTKTADEIDTAKNEVIKIVEEIKGDNFKPNAGNLCDFCPFKIICEAWK